MVALRYPSCALLQEQEDDAMQRPFYSKTFHHAKCLMNYYEQNVVDAFSLVTISLSIRGCPSRVSGFDGGHAVMYHLKLNHRGWHKRTQNTTYRVTESTELRC